MIEKEVLAKYLAEGMSLPEIGRLVGQPPGTVGYWVKRHGLVANGASMFSPHKEPLSRARIAELMSSGLTLQQIAGELNATIGRVRHWIAKYELGETRHLQRVAKVREARFQGDSEVVLHCPRHGVTEFWVGRKAVRCRKCNVEGVMQRRRKVKAILIREAGGSCQLCGFNAVQAALHFHHLDPSTKSFGISEAGVSRAISTSRVEAQKCMLLCANCHAGVEVGELDLPVESREPPDRAA